MEGFVGFVVRFELFLGLRVSRDGEMDRRMIILFFFGVVFFILIFFVRFVFVFVMC